MSDRYIRIEATVTYDGAKGVPWLQTGQRHKVRFDGMKDNDFMLNIGMVVEGEIHYGETGEAVIDLLTDSESLSLLKVGTVIGLYDSPSKVGAHGVVKSVVGAPSDRLPDEAY